MRKLNKKGFTLVELLAVIVILAVVMLIAVTAVGPLMSKARKSALGTEGIGMIKAAEAAYQSTQMSGSFSSTDSVCFDLRWLCKHGYFEKGCDGSGAGDKYSGSVLAYYSGGKMTYTFWISNGNYAFGGNNTAGVANNLALSQAANATIAQKGINSTYDVENNSVVADGAVANNHCGLKVASNKLTGAKYCLYSVTTANNTTTTYDKCA